MFLRQLDLTSALRPSLFDDEALLFVQDGVGLYNGQERLPDYQNGHAYLTTHRICYVDNKEPRKFSVAIELRDVERTEFYAGFLKSSPKITLFPKPNLVNLRGLGRGIPIYSSPARVQAGHTPNSPRSGYQSPAPFRALNATWICPICGLSNAVPTNFDPSTANQYTPLPPCQACGIQPPLALMIKSAIAAMSNRASGTTSELSGSPRGSGPGRPLSETTASTTPDSRASHECPRCTFQNHPSLSACEMCGAPLQSFPNLQTLRLDQISDRPGTPDSTINENIESIKFSFRAGYDKSFSEKLKGALIQRKWLLQSAPPVPKPIGTPPQGAGSGYAKPPGGSPRAAVANQSHQRVVGIAGLEQRGAALRQNNQAVIGTAFEDLEALMASAKEVIAMAEQFARQTSAGNEGDSEARRIISDSASALGLITTKEMLGSGSAAEQLYITELSRNLAEYLTDDRKGILRKEGGIISLVDLWQVFNRSRNGIELVSPQDFEKAATMWESLNLPVRLRRFKSGLLVVQEKSRTDAKTVAALLAWLREPSILSAAGASFGKGVTAQETAERFGWSIGVATEELEMAEELGSLCRDQCLDGTRFWENHLVLPAALVK